MKPADRAGWAGPCLGWLVEGLGWAAGMSLAWVVAGWAVAGWAGR